MSSRIHLLGIDKQNTASIRVGGHILLPDLRLQAQRHEKHRLDSVAEVLAMIAVLVHRRVLRGNEVVAIKGALYQFDQGMEANHTHAAHCLPGHLTFNTFSIHDLDTWDLGNLTQRGLKPIPAAAKLRHLGGRTDVMDSRVNNADSLLERLSDTRGLAPLLSRAVGRMIQNPALTRSAGWAPVRRAAQDAFTHYRDSAAFVCEERLDHLAVSFAKATGPQAQSIREKAAVVTEYVHILRGAHSPECLEPQNFDGLVRDLVVADAGAKA